LLQTKKFTKLNITYNIFLNHKDDPFGLQKIKCWYKGVLKRVKQVEV